MALCCSCDGSGASVTTVLIVTIVGVIVVAIHGSIYGKRRYLSGAGRRLGLDEQTGADGCRHRRRGTAECV